MTLRPCFRFRCHQISGYLPNGKFWLLSKQNHEHAPLSLAKTTLQVAFAYSLCLSMPTASATITATAMTAPTAIQAPTGVWVLVMTRTDLTSLKAA